MVSGFLIGIVIAAVIVIIIVTWLIMLLISKSKGKIEIILDKSNYSQGDTITGKINLTIKKPIKSKALSIRLVAIGIVSGEIRKGAIKPYGKSQVKDETKIFDFKQPVEGTKEYQPGQELNYDFKIKIPKDLEKSPRLGPIIGAEDNQTTTIKWNLIADLDITGINISKKIPVNII